ncbi:hypothetical protein GF337_13060 [candidate division KSB1 bacterium]|nr:hypothetical protein [candidate division KSB1 bacterium]
MSREITNIFLTGKINIGKSTVLEKVLRHQIFKGLNTGGYRTRAIVENEIHTGYALDAINGASREFAHIGMQSSQKFDRYYVDPSVFDDLGVSALQSALKTADVILLDEIGIIEKECQEFKRLVFDCLDSQKIVLGIYQSRAYWFSKPLSDRNDAVSYEVTRHNRDGIYDIIIALLHKLKK